jgi:hypothetical protein
VSKHIVHWDDIESSKAEAGGIRSTWTGLGTAAGSKGVGLNRIQVDPRDFTSDHGELLTILRTELQVEGPTPLWNAVNVGITALLHQQGRRVVLVFTDGMDAPMNFSGNNSSLKDVMKRAEEENVMVYAIGLAGSGGYGRGSGGPSSSLSTSRMPTRPSRKSPGLPRWREPGMPSWSVWTPPTSPTAIAPIVTTTKTRKADSISRRWRSTRMTR